MLLTGLAGCGKVRISDAEFCGDKGPEGAECFNLLTDNERSLTLPEWDEERFGMICTKSATFVEWKKAIIKLCSLTRRCYYDTTENAVRFGDKVQAFTKEITGEQNENTSTIGAGER